MALKAKLYYIFLSFRFLPLFLLRGLTWVVLRAWSQNHPQVVGTCPGHHPQPIAQNRVFKIEKPKPPLTLGQNGILRYSHFYGFLEP